MADTKYNGWNNYETWAVKLWLDNDYGTYTLMKERAGEILSDNTEEDEDERKTVDEDGFKRDMANYVEEYTKEEAPELGASVYSDLLNAALSEVDWYEIAEAYLDEAKEAAE